MGTGEVGAAEALGGSVEDVIDQVRFWFILMLFLFMGVEWIRKKISFFVCVDISQEIILSVSCLSNSTSCNLSLRPCLNLI